MLKDILREINNSDHISISAIAGSLSLSEDMVKDGLDQLIRMNYLKEQISSNTCGGKCSGCAAAHCSSTPMKTFSITEKGLHLLEK